MIIPTTSGSDILWKLNCAYILVGCLLPVVDTHNNNCKVIQHPNYTTTYELPESLPLANCETQWLDENMTVLANDKERDENCTLAQTSHSITVLGCLDRLTYSMDCMLTVMTVLANDKERDENCTLAQTSHSITVLGCLDRLTYSMDCMLTVAPFWEVQCLTNCSHGPYKPATNRHSNDHVPINQELDYCQVYSPSSPPVFTSPVY
ncbi:uncharacterized protein LOC135520741 isoform X1 [Oncorhynchus masou masou]|uniref:uncharacterized protein LOC135520741 isoform X1 n=1 Tax=Oncorhynchus masou masou TaxID=90313 RepID=UPI0031841E8E